MNIKPLSLKTQALRKRQRQAAEQGVKALAQYEADGVAIRKNMARLRALRLAKEAEATASDPQPQALLAKLRNDAEDVTER